MKVTNKAKIPNSLFRYLSQDNYDYKEKGDSLSATELLKPTQIVVLKRRYFKKIEVDAVDRLWVLLGEGVHSVLEKEKGIEKIERLKTKVLGREVSGKWDRIFDNTITDYKVTSAWTILHGSRNEEWKRQLSIYRWLYFKNKKVLLNKFGYIVALLRDWSERNKGASRYPLFPAVEIELPLLGTKTVEDFVTQRVREITKAEKLPDHKLPKCTDEERWKNKSTGAYIRCKKYCDVARFCKQWKNGKK